MPIEFIFGIVVGLCYVHGRMPHRGKVLAAGVLAALAVWFASVHLGQIPLPNSMGRVVAFGIPFALILYGAVAFEAEGLFVAPMWLVAIGDASYAAYLWHFSTINVLRQIVLRVGPEGRLAEIATLAASLAAVLLVSLAVYRFFEKPVTAKLNALARERLRARGQVPMPRVIAMASPNSLEGPGA